MLLLKAKAKADAFSVFPINCPLGIFTRDTLGQNQNNFKRLFNQFMNKTIEPIVVKS